MKKSIILFSLLMLAFCSRGDKNVSHPSSEVTQEAGHAHQRNEHAAGEQSKREGDIHTSMPADREQGHPEGEHAHEDLIIPLDKQKEWGIATGTPALQKVASQLILPGILSLNQNRTAHISSIAHGQVTLLSADLGVKVRKGQSLVTINSPEFGQAQADFLTARAELNLSKIEYDRAKMLLAKDAIGEREYLRRKAEYEKWTTEYGALGSKLHSFGITHDQIDALIAKCAEIETKEYKCEIADPNLPILSPLSGTVIFRDLMIGEHIEPQKILFTVSDLTTLWALLDGYEKDIPSLAATSEVRIQSSLYPDRDFPGKITYISDSVDEKLRTVKIRVEVQNAQGLLKPNMYIQGILESRGEGTELLSVPDEAVLNWEGGKIVFVMEKEETFSLRYVRTGEKIGEARVILAGLSRSDRLVIKGAFTVKTELTKGSLGHAHVH